MRLSIVMPVFNERATLEERANRGSKEKLLAVLAKAPDVEPEEHDRL